MHSLSKLAGLVVLATASCAGPNVDRAAQERFLAELGRTTVTVFPAHVNRAGGEEFDERAAARIAALANERGWFDARTSSSHVSLPTAWYMNEAKMLGDSAAAFADFVREHPVETRYALIADYLLGTHGVGGVHVVVVDGEGRVVDVSLWNSHWDAFREVQPKDVDGCTEVVLRGLARQWPARAGSAAPER
ncbi:MAG: hypothetical protein L6Q99_10510 [Planctomycetes bacterium]|nr:hypothetical protein [Planctomycetota bacterium]